MRGNRAPEWTQLVVQDLQEAKARGEQFEQAWKRAIARHRPRTRDYGSPRPTLFPEQGVDESPVEFMYRACDDAWHGRRPELRGLRVLLDRDGGMLG